LRLSKVQGDLANKDPKDKKKGDANEVVEEQYQSRRLIKLELLEEDKPLVYAIGYNEITLSNVLLDSTQEGEKNYYLQATFDLREWPECKDSNDETNDLYWFVRVSGATDTIVFVKDTQK